MARRPCRGTVCRSLMALSGVQSPRPFVFRRDRVRTRLFFRRRRRRRRRRWNGARSRSVGDRGEPERLSSGLEAIESAPERIRG